LADSALELLLEQLHDLVCRGEGPPGFGIAAHPQSVLVLDGLLASARLEAWQSEEMRAALWRTMIGPAH
jgi:hypothetical protein